MNQNSDVFASRSGRRASSDVAMFLREWLRAPLRVAAVAPSGRNLAALITREISARSGPVLELGPGTGVFTQAMLGRGLREEDLTLVEYSPDFARMLRSRFPRARILNMDAENLEQERIFPEASAGAVVCGLGLLSMPPEKVARILQGALSVLRPEGALFLFTYGPRCPTPEGLLEDLGLQADLLGKTWRNLPPASVYRIRRRADS